MDKNLLSSSQSIILLLMIASVTTCGVICLYSISKRKRLKKIFRPILLDEDACGILKFIGQYGYFAAFVASEDLGLSKKLSEVLTNFFVDSLHNLFENESKDQALNSLIECLAIYIPRKSRREPLSLLLMDAALSNDYSNNDLLKIIKEV